MILIATDITCLTGSGYYYNLDRWRLAFQISTLISVALFVTWWNTFPGNVPIQANLGNIVALITRYYQVQLAQA